jgi:hypothetical protein
VVIEVEVFCIVVSFHRGDGDIVAEKSSDLPLLTGEILPVTGERAILCAQFDPGCFCKERPVPDKARAFSWWKLECIVSPDVV